MSEQPSRVMRTWPTPTHTLNISIQQRYGGDDPYLLHPDTSPFQQRYGGVKIFLHIQKCENSNSFALPNRKGSLKNHNSLYEIVVNLF
jgi:hypothetical protein